MIHDSSRLIYLDHNSTTPMLPEVAEAMSACFRAGYMNPASPHQAGRRARARLEEARDAIAELLGARTGSGAADRLIFTSGGTEANNLALRGLSGQPGRQIVLSSIEHPSVAACGDYLRSSGFQVHQLPASPQGVTQLDALPELLERPTALVSLMLGNNETGVLQPVAEAAAICRQHQVPLHTDAVQAVGKIPVDFAGLDVSALSFSAHKFHGPRGIGGLLVRGDVDLTPITYGGSQQLGARPGTESVTLAVGMQRALELWHLEAQQRYDHMTRMRDELQRHIQREIVSAVVHGASVERLPHTLNVSFPGLDRQALLIALDRSGVACSTGSACASGSQEPSPVLLAMGCDRALVDSSLRISVGFQTTPQEVAAAGAKLVQIVRKMGGK